MSSGAAQARTIQALIDIVARNPIASVPRLAPALKGPRGVETGRVHVAIMRAGLALVDIDTADTRAHIPGVAAANKRTRRIGARGLYIAIVQRCSAFVHFGTCTPVSGITQSTGTRERARIVATSRPRGSARVRRLRAFVDV